MDTRTRKRYAAYAAATVLSIVAFTPAVVPYGVYEPWLFGMPRTLWSGILLTIALVFVTYLVGRYSPDDLDKSEEASETGPSANPRRSS